MHSAIAHSVPEACLITHTGRTSLYEAIRSGALRAVKRGRRTLILDEDLRRWLQTLPLVKVEFLRKHSTVEAAMTNAPEANSTPNPFDPATLRLDQSYADTVGVKKLLTTVPVRKPNRQDFVRVHPDPDVRLTPAAIIEVKEDREVYLVTPNMAQALPGEFSTVTLFSRSTASVFPSCGP